MIAIFKHELRLYFHSLTAYVFGAFLLLIVGIGAMLYNLQAAVSNFEYVLSFSSMIFAVIVPILTMRVIAEERKQKTDQLLYSLPISTTKIIVGKYLALLTVYAIPCGVIAFYPLILNMFGEVNLLGGYSCLLYFFLLGASLIAVCQFLSSLTDNLVVAAVLGILGTLVLYVLPIPGYLLDGVPILSDLLVFLSPFVHFQNAGSYGLFSIPSVILLLSYTVFFVFLTVRSADRKRWA